MHSGVKQRFPEFPVLGSEGVGRPGAGPLRKHV